MPSENWFEPDPPLVDGASNQDLLDSWMASMPNGITAAELARSPIHDPEAVAQLPGGPPGSTRTLGARGVGATVSPRSAGPTWRSWDARLGQPGPVHGPRRDRPDGTKDIPWPPGLDGHAMADLIYFPGGTPPPAGAAVVATEGEKAADAAAETGVFAAGIVGGAASTLGPAVIELLLKYDLTLSPDADPGGLGLMCRLAKALEMGGLAELDWIDPPADAPKGWDLADVSVAERRAMIDGARKLLGFGYVPGAEEPSPDPEPDWGGLAGSAALGADGELRPPFRSAAELLEPADLGVWNIEDVCRPGTVVVVAGVEGVAKTQILREIGIRAATGTGSLFGHYAIPRALRVMVCDEENGEAEEWRREVMVLEAVGRQRSDLTGYFRVSFAGMVLTDAKAQAWLMAQAAKILPDLIILDTGTSMIADEWGPEMKAAMRFVRSLCVRFGCSVVIAVHMTKPARDRRPNDAAHGTAISHVMGQWTRSADAVALVADLGADRIRFEMRKKVPPSTLILVKRLGIFEVVSVGDARKPSTDDRVLNAIAAGADSIEALVVGLGLSRATVFRALGGLRKDGLVGPGTPLELTADGSDAVS